MNRKRKCQSCEKPLGSTTGLCYDCGGETYRAGGTETAEQWATWWKLELGVPHSKIQAAHEEFSHKEGDGE